MEQEHKRYYWLKLKKDFFKRHDIRIIEAMPNGKEYVLVYLKLLIESIDHDGCLRFSDTIPYNEEMLSVITDSNIDIIRSALKIFKELNLVELLDDNTLYLNEVSKMMGSETQWAEKKRLYRGQCPQNVLPMSDKSKSIEKEKDIELEKDIIVNNNLNNNIIPSTDKTKDIGCREKEKEVASTNIIDKSNNIYKAPSYNEIATYAFNQNRLDLIDKFFNYYEERKWKDGGDKHITDWKSKFTEWANKSPTPTKKYGK